MSRSDLRWWTCAAFATALLVVPASYLAATAPATHRATFGNALSIHPDDAARALERGATAIRDDRAAEALAILVPLSRQVDDDARTWNDLCVAHALLHDYAAAIGACERALRLAPGFQLAENNLRWTESERARTTESSPK